MPIMWEGKHKPVFDALNRVVESIEPFEIEEQVELYAYAIRNLAAMRNFKDIIWRQYRKAGVEEDAKD